MKNTPQLTGLAKQFNKLTFGASDFSCAEEMLGIEIKTKATSRVAASSFREDVLVNSVDIFIGIRKLELCYA